jgi:hypothetical protein
MTDLDKLKKAYTEINVDFVVREDGEFQYLFIGKPEHASDIRWMDDNFETTDLDALQRRNSFFEFENGKLASY